MAEIGVFYRVFFNPPRPGGSGRIYNLTIPDTENPETYPVIDMIRPKLEALYPDVKTLTILHVCRDGPILKASSPKSRHIRYTTTYQIRTDQGWSPEKTIGVTFNANSSTDHVRAFFLSMIRDHHRDIPLTEADIDLKPWQGELV